MSRLADRLTKMALRWTIRFMERRERRLTSALEDTRYRLQNARDSLHRQTVRDSFISESVGRYRWLRWAVRSLEKHERYLVTTLEDNKRKLQEAQEVYIRAYVSKYWRGKSLEDTLQ